MIMIMMSIMLLIKVNLDDDDVLVCVSQLLVFLTGGDEGNDLEALGLVRRLAHMDDVSIDLVVFADSVPATVRNHMM
jgi:hypothetical protein